MEIRFDEDRYRWQQERQCLEKEKASLETRNNHLVERSEESKMKMWDHIESAYSFENFWMTGLLLMLVITVDCTGDLGGSGRTPPLVWRITS